LKLSPEIGQVDVEELQDRTCHRVGVARQSDRQMTDSDEVGFREVGRDLEAALRTRRAGQLSGW
jgi:hypothetical protein